ncbi:YbdD/YjiX family protein [Humidisolicoccus flavus]|uniref:YbdD/YjiX family protein n=1 Tax=Humidisolicoccus flavus TaxID=3111414 RepID=UPI00324D9EB3
MTEHVNPAAGDGELARYSPLRVFRAVRWYVRELMGDNAYEVYCAHQDRNHPDGPRMTEREFWRDRTDAQDKNPGARCC